MTSDGRKERTYVAMAEDTNVDPADLRTVGNAHYGMAAYYRDKAEPDMDYVTGLSSFGSGGADFTEWARGYVLETRVAGWTSVADGHQTLGDIHHANANDFENTDAAGGSSVRTADVGQLSPRGAEA